MENRICAFKCLLVRGVSNIRVFVWDYHLCIGYISHIYIHVWIFRPPVNIWYIKFVFRSKDNLIYYQCYWNFKLVFRQYTTCKSVSLQHKDEYKGVSTWISIHKLFTTIICIWIFTILRVLILCKQAVKPLGRKERTSPPFTGMVVLHLIEFLV